MGIIPSLFIFFLQLLIDSIFYFTLIYVTLFYKNRFFIQRGCRNMRNFLNKLLYGRYGVDQFSVALVGISVLFSLLFTFTDWAVFYIISSVLLLFALYRVFSKKFTQRQKENQKWAAFSFKFKKHFNKFIKRVKDFPHYRYYTCLNCKQTLRIPRGKGRIEIRCPKCGYSFRSKT